MNAKLHFAKALQHLLTDKRIDDITIAEIVENSEFGKSTFYNHFKDKYDLVAWIHFNDCYSKALKLLDSGGQYFDCIRAMCDYIADSKDFYKNTTSSKDHNSMKGYFHDIAIDFNKEFLSRSGLDVTDEDTSMLIQALSHGQVFLTVNWIKNNCDMPTKKFIELAAHLLPVKLASYFIQD